MGLQTAYANLAGLSVRKTFRWIPFCTEVNKLFAPINGIVQAVCTDVSIEPAAPRRKNCWRKRRWWCRNRMAEVGRKFLWMVVTCLPERYVLAKVTENFAVLCHSGQVTALKMEAADRLRNVSVYQTAPSVLMWSESYRFQGILRELRGNLLPSSSGCQPDAAFSPTPVVLI